MKQVLLLNADYLAHDLISIQDAMIHICNEKVDIVYNYDSKLRSPSMEMDYPSVIRLKRYAKVDRVTKLYEPYNRRNIYKRDHGECQYCGGYLTFSKMTLDHVVPRALGGKTNFNNIVACCKKCNSYKDCLPLDKLSMKLKTKPAIPYASSNLKLTLIEKLKNQITDKNYHHTWEDFLMWRTK